MKQMVLEQGWKLMQYKGEPFPEWEQLYAYVKEDAEKAYAIDRMPAQVQDVLRACGDLEPLWKPNVCSQAQWIAESDWIYYVDFSKHASQGYQSWLCFEGLDTLTDVYLNGTCVLHADDVYLPWKAEISELLQEENTLIVYFPSALKYIREADRPEHWIGRYSQFRVLRKMDQDFNDYLGPKPYFVKTGIFDTVSVKQYEHVCPDNLDISYSLDDTLNTGCIEVNVSAYGGPEAELFVSLISPDGEEIFNDVQPLMPLRRDCLEAYSRIYVSNPKLWWIRGFGEQNLYQLNVEIRYKKSIEFSNTYCVGFRRVEFDASMSLKLNHRHIKLRGANLAPIDSTTLCWDQMRVNRLLDLAENSHMNILRVWGENGPMQHGLYNEADRRGIMIWQDFFTNSFIPEDEKHAQYFLREVEYTVKKLKAHPCIMLWCGGNESIMWYQMSEAEYPFEGIDTLKEMGAICKKYDPDRYYHLSSPCGGDFPNDPTEGNTHGYTNIWFVPGYDYQVFTTEDTRICAPAYKSLKRFFAPEHLWPEGYSATFTYREEYPWPETWMNYTACDSWHKCGPIEQFRDAQDAPSLVYRLGAAEALYYRRTIERNRCGRHPEDASGKRINNGYLYWKLNDSFPEIYSSKVDYFLEPYIPYYVIKRAYSPIMLTFEINNFLYLWAVNDSREAIRGTIVIKLFDMKRNCIVQETKRLISLQPGESRVAARLDEFRQFNKHYVLFAELRDDLEHIIARVNDFVEIERNLRFPDAVISIEAKGDYLTVTTDQFAHCVELSGGENGEELDWLFEDNYFDLLPGEKKHIKVMGLHDQGIITAKAHYSSQVTQLKWQRSQL